MDHITPFVATFCCRTPSKLKLETFSFFQRFRREKNVSGDEHDCKELSEDGRTSNDAQSEIV
ncbi:hypothetical protein V1478_000079 [Vespula squamosa]|uniref:Uncharacterized protein n=1 Tax=Vespula squamosa TaxID=30214 RepID=A0ABD2CB80_VESSQ